MVSAGFLLMAAGGCKSSSAGSESQSAATTGADAAAEQVAVVEKTPSPQSEQVLAEAPLKAAPELEVEPASPSAPMTASPEAAGVSQADGPDEASWEWSVIGSSREGRAIEATTFGSGPLRVYIVGNIHGDENEGLETIDALPWILGDGPVGTLATTRVVRDVNPDGTAAGTRGNAVGRDLNRNWPATNFTPRASTGPAPLSEPETESLHQDLSEVDPHLVIVFHSSPRGPFVNYDGPAVGIAAAFVEAAIASESRWKLVPEMGYPTPGSLGSYVGVDRQVPILTIEFRRGQSPESVLAAAIDGVTAAVERATLAK